MSDNRHGAGPQDPDAATLRIMSDELNRLRAQVARYAAAQAAVPPALAAALSCPPRSRPVRVRLGVHGRTVTVWVTAAGEKVNPAEAWAAIQRAVPETRAGTPQLRADLPGITAIRDGRALIVSAAASRMDVRACRRTAAAAAIAGSAAAAVLRRLKTSAALRAGLGGAAAAAFVAVGALTIGHHNSGSLPPGALAPSVSGVSPRSAARIVPGVRAPGTAGSPDAAGALPRSDTPAQGRAPAAKLTILPAIPQPHKTTTPASPQPGTSPASLPGGHVPPTPHTATPAPQPTWTQPSPHPTTPGPTITVPLPSPLPTITVPVPRVTIPFGVLPPHVLPSPIPQVVHHVGHVVHHLVHKVHHLVRHLVHHLLPTPLPTPSIPLPLPSPTLPGGL